MLTIEFGRIYGRSLYMPFNFSVRLKIFTIKYGWGKKKKREVWVGVYFISRSKYFCFIFTDSLVSHPRPVIRAELVNTTAVLFVFHYLQPVTLREVAKNRTVCGFWPWSFPALKWADHTKDTMPGVGEVGGIALRSAPISASCGLFPSTGGTHVPVASWDMMCGNVPTLPAHWIHSLAVSRILGGRSFSFRILKVWLHQCNCWETWSCFISCFLMTCVFSLEACGILSVPIVLKFLSDVFWGGVFLFAGLVLSLCKRLSFRSGKLPSIFS